MKKLVIIVFLAGFVGLSFAYSPANVISSKEISTSLFTDSTKTKKKSTTSSTKKEGCSKSCKTKCSKSTTSETPKK